MIFFEYFICFIFIFFICVKYLFLIANQFKNLQFIGWLKNITNKKTQHFYEYYLYFNTQEKTFVIFSMYNLQLKYILNDIIKQNFEIKHNKILKFNNNLYQIYIDKK